MSVHINLPNDSNSKLSLFSKPALENCISHSLDRSSIGPLSPSASLCACVRARLADGGCGPGWPGQRATRLTWAEGAGKKLFFSYRNFAASRLRVSRGLGPPDLPPLHERSPGKSACHCNITANPDGPAHTRRPQAAARPDGGGHKQQSGPERHKSAALRLPGAAAGSSQESLCWRIATNLSVSSLCLCAFVVWSAVTGYNYQLIVIANTDIVSQNPAPGKLPLPEAGSPGPPASCPRARAPACMRARLADGGCGPGWPWPASGSTYAARGLWQKLSFSYRNFAASCLRVSP